MEEGGLDLGLAAGDLRIDGKAKIRERFFVFPPKRSTKNKQACSSPRGRWDPVL